MAVVVYFKSVSVALHAVSEHWTHSYFFRFNVATLDKFLNYFFVMAEKRLMDYLLESHDHIFS